jgi:hypothetical protein
MSLFSNYKVEYFSGSAWVQIPDLVALDCTVGRKQVTDSWSVSTASFTFRYPTGFTSPNTALLVDVGIRFFSPGNTVTAAWTGFIRDVKVTWGMPFQAGVGEADLLTIDAEGAMGRWGRTDGDGFTPSVALANGQLTEVANHYGLNWNGNLTSEPVKPVATEGPLSDWMQTFMNTVQGRLIDGAPRSSFDDVYRQGSVFIFSNATNLTTLSQFSDVSNDSTNAIYNVLDFDTLADNYITRVVTTAPLLADQVSSVGTAPFRSFVLETYATTVEQASDLADYYLASVDDQVVAPNAVSVVSGGQNGTNIDTMNTDIFAFLPAYKTRIQFRGTTVAARIEGATMRATPEQTRVTYYLSSAESNPYFILDSADFGILDTNKLGLYVY